MNLRALFLVSTVAGLLAGSGVQAETSESRLHDATDGLALTPPMGWYPWNQFGQDPQNEQLIKEIADAVVQSGMREAGYSFVGPDEGICFRRSTNGLLSTVESRYPSGLQGLGDYIHQLGLKYALYTDAGTNTCSGAMPGTKGHEFEDMRRFADWRCDYVKIDWCNTEGMEPTNAYTLLHEAQLSAGRPIVHSLCSWGVGSPWNWAAPVGHLWRTTGDICGPGHADYENATKIAFFNQALYQHAGPGYWNDPDMLIVGMAGLSEAQNRTIFSLWCLMASPLIAGNDVRTMSSSTLAILTNLEAIAVNQDPLGIQGHVVSHANGVSVWAGKRLFDGSQAVVIYNERTAPAQMRVDWHDLGLKKSSKLYVRDLWTHQSTGPLVEGITLTVPAQDVLMLRLSKTRSFPIPPIISADSYLISLQASGPAAQTLTGQLTVKTVGTDALPLWQVRSNLPGWLSVKVTKSGKRQAFSNTIRTAGLAKGHYHAVVRADNTEPVSGKPMSALYYDVDLNVQDDVASR